MFTPGAEGRTRTGTSRPTTPSRWRVYQVPPLRQCLVIILKERLSASLIFSFAPRPPVDSGFFPSPQPVALLLFRLRRRRFLLGLLSLFRRGSGFLPGRSRGRFFGSRRRHRSSLFHRRLRGLSRHRLIHDGLSSRRRLFGHRLHRCRIGNRGPLGLFHRNVVHDRPRLGSRGNIAEPKARQHENHGCSGGQFAEKSCAAAAAEERLRCPAESRPHLRSSSRLKKNDHDKGHTGQDMNDHHH